MKLPLKIKWLLIISILVIVLAVFINREIGNDRTHGELEPQPIPRIDVPKDIDPKALEKTPTPIAPKSVVAPKPAVSAEAYLVANLDTGEIYSTRNAKKVFPIASLSKLVTALVALHNMSPDQKITITKEILDGGYGEAGHLVLGETFTVYELLTPLLLESSNDAAEALAQSYSYTGFIKKMNEFVAELGMTKTIFKDASGLSSSNVSNAEDLLILARYIYTEENSLLDITKEVTAAVATTTEHGGHVWKTINPFALDPHFIGGKTGRTNEAKESMISLFRYVHKNISYPIAIIVLRSDFKVREKDSEYLFEQFLQKIDKK